MSEKIEWTNRNLLFQSPLFAAQSTSFRMQCKTILFNDNYGNVWDVPNLGYLRQLSLLLRIWGCFLVYREIVSAVMDQSQADLPQSA